MSKTDDFVLFHAFEDELSAHRVKALFDDAGVDAYLADVHTTAVANAFAGATEIRLMVRSVDMERAAEVMNSTVPAPLSEEELTAQALEGHGGDWAAEDDESEYGSTLLQCPQCHGHQVALTSNQSIYIVTIALFIGAGILVALFSPQTVLRILGLLSIGSATLFALFKTPEFPRRCRICDYEAGKEEFQ